MTRCNHFGTGVHIKIYFAEMRHRGVECQTVQVLHNSHTLRMHYRPPISFECAPDSRLDNLFGKIVAIVNVRHETFEFVFCKIDFIKVISRINLLEDISLLYCVILVEKIIY